MIPHGGHWRTLVDKTTLIGFVAVAIALAVGLVLAGLYLRPLGQRDVVFLTTDAALVKPGNEVRASGVKIGSVHKVDLEAQDVKVTLKIDDGVYLGDRTTAAVRMLTVAGGFYVSLSSAGGAPLGAAIPADRVNLPYTISDMLQQVPTKLQPLDEKQLADSLSQVTTGLDTNPDGLISLAKGVDSLIDQLTKQREDVGRIAQVASDYSESFARSRVQLFEMLRKASIAVTVLDETHVGFAAAYRGLGELFGRISTITSFYDKHREQIYTAVKELEASVAKMNVTFPGLIAQFHGLVDTLQKMLDKTGRPDGAKQLLATQMCFPSPGVTC
ncbi:MlaD family protein [Tsukamurella sp. 8F]|uniref:MlaD family protein n=1 Tax=unclassified Tsukamurella TaxID=2633480 RepID=UPI0023B912F5|nr:MULTISPECIES: MlaD family protein [unclassified Tsukamurella]MDF0530744.1 MlaD family protein [Tsukamurella sp. 8J]MDF0587945.1 MlaD family protein [Tsukamurella sp. 8F]